MKTIPKILGLDAPTVIGGGQKTTEPGHYITPTAEGPIHWSYRRDGEFGRLTICDPQEADCIAVHNCGAVRVQSAEHGAAVYRVDLS